MYIHALQQVDNGNLTVGHCSLFVPAQINPPLFCLWVRNESRQNGFRNAKFGVDYMQIQAGKIWFSPNGNNSTIFNGVCWILNHVTILTCPIWKRVFDYTFVKLTFSPSVLSFYLTFFLSIYLTFFISFREVLVSCCFLSSFFFFFHV